MSNYQPQVGFHFLEISISLEVRITVALLSQKMKILTFSFSHMHMYVMGLCISVFPGVWMHRYVKVPVYMSTHGGLRSTTIH